MLSVNERPSKPANMDIVRTDRDLFPYTMMSADICSDDKVPDRKPQPKINDPVITLRHAIEQAESKEKEMTVKINEIQTDEERDEQEKQAQMKAKAAAAAAASESQGIGSQGQGVSAEMESRVGSGGDIRGTAKVELDRTRRVLREMRDLFQNPHPAFDIYPSDQNMFFWQLTLQGPDSTPYGMHIYIWAVCGVNVVCMLGVCDVCVCGISYFFLFFLCFSVENPKRVIFFPSESQI